MLTKEDIILINESLGGTMEEHKFQWTGAFSKAVNGVMISENFTFRMDSREELEVERKNVLDKLTPSSKSFPEDEGDMAHEETTSQSPMCAVHRTPMTFKQAGISKKTGKPYAGFWSCGIKNTDNTFCNYRPEK